MHDDDHYLPKFCFFMWGHAARVTMNDPLKWTRWIRSGWSDKMIRNICYIITAGRDNLWFKPPTPVEVTCPSKGSITQDSSIINDDIWGRRQIRNGYKKKNWRMQTMEETKTYRSVQNCLRLSSPVSHHPPQNLKAEHNYTILRMESHRDYSLRMNIRVSAYSQFAEKHFRHRFCEGLQIVTNWN